MKLNHTPGPWNMVGLNGDRIAIVAHDATDVATLTHANHADARLIAAAPELLACLLTMPQSMASTEQEWWDWVDTVNEVLHKATDGAWK